MIITMKDLREVTYCSKGVRAFFREHDLDWSDFLKNGISSEKLKHIDSAFIDAVITHKVAHGRV